jgi:hypothetical protein
MVCVSEFLQTRQPGKVEATGVAADFRRNRKMDEMTKGRSLDEE